MTQTLKASKYNHIIATEDGGHLAFNALSCGLAKIDEKHYEQFVKFCNGNDCSEVITTGDEEFLEKLKFGRYVLSSDSNEMDLIRVRHYSTRFGESATGMTIIPTLNCNFACDYCYENEDMHISSKNSEKMMSESVQANLLSLAKSKIKYDSTFFVTWYGGEPLLRQDIIASLTDGFKGICEEKKAQYRAGVITNGYLLTEKTLKFLVDSNVTFCQVTIDGAKKIHDSRRPLRSGGKTYDRIVHNLEAITEEQPISILIRVNIDNRNEETIADLLTDFKRRGFHQRKNISLYFGQVLHYRSSCRDISQFCMITKEFANFQIRAYNEALEMGFIITMYPLALFGSCGAVSPNTYIVEPSGTVHNCWNTIGIENMKTGELNSKGVNYNDNYLKWLSWSPFREECKDCNVLPLCMGGCPYKSLYKFDVTDVEKNTCTWWKYNLPQMLDIHYKASKLGLLAAHLVANTKQQKP